ncbi:hypothetical protein AN958_01871 [Leucoagaricus sp. SymC.cos]|nr:hypothetical protein AN958_01871 [Leucoagaricus sp. SymC.cos]
MSNLITATTPAPTSILRPLTWLVTGTSSGFGYRLTLIALDRGDYVVATARSLTKLQKLVDEVSRDADSSKKERLRTLGFDLGDPEETVKEMVKEAKEIWGRIDVLVNNAGWAWRGMLEESGVSALQWLSDTNVIGTAKITFAVLPYMRAQRSGTIVTIGSRSAWRTELPVIGSYAMVKAALRAFTENLSAELAPFNIRTLLVEPGAFRTEGIYSPGWCENHLSPDYDTIRESARKAFEEIPGNEPGDAFKAMAAVVDVVRSEGVAKGRPWPGYLFLGEDCEAAVKNKCSRTLGLLEEWKDVTRDVAFD